MNHACASVSNLADHSVRIKHLVFLLHAGHRVAELELHIALSYLRRNFEMEYHDKTPIEKFSSFQRIQWIYQWKTHRCFLIYLQSHVTYRNGKRCGSILTTCLASCLCLECPSIQNMSVSLNSRLVSRVLCVRQYLQCRHPPKPLVQLSRSLTQPQVDQSADQHQPEPKPFSEVPAAKGWPLLGTFMDYGKPDTLNKTYRVMQQRVKKLGWIYREKPLPTLPEMLIVVDPDDVQTVFRADGKWPSRITLDAWVESTRQADVPPGIFML